MAHREADLFRVVLPRVEAHLRIGREIDALHRGGVGMGRHVVGQHQYRGLAVAHKIAADGEHEIRPLCVHVLQEGVAHRHRDVRPAFAQCRGPALDVVVIEQGGHRRPEAARLRRHRRDDAPSCALQQIPDERAADAVAQRHEFANTEMVQEAEHVVGVGIPRPVDLERAGGLPAIRIAQIEGDAAVFVLELGGRVERRGGGVPGIGNGRVQPSAGDDQQRKAGTASVLVIDPDIAFFVKRHRVSPRKILSGRRYWAAAASGCAATAGRLFLRKPRTCRSAS